jgi:hypothetical protein
MSIPSPNLRLPGVDLALDHPALLRRIHVQPPDSISSPVRDDDPRLSATGATGKEGSYGFSEDVRFLEGGTSAQTGIVWKQLIQFNAIPWTALGHNIGHDLSCRVKATDSGFATGLATLQLYLNDVPDSLIGAINIDGPYVLTPNVGYSPLASFGSVTPALVTPKWLLAVLGTRADQFIAPRTYIESFYVRFYDGGP